MSAAATIAGLALAATAAATLVVIAMVDGQLTTNSTSPTSTFMQLSGNQNNGQLIDPNGPSVQFILYTRDNPPANLKVGDETAFKNSGFNKTSSTKIIIHGFTSSIRDIMFMKLKKGLDPARPGYRDNRLDNKLDLNDAMLVDCLHTFIQVLGLAEPVGHIDFYANGGMFQPGCPDLNDMWKIGESLYCNHGRAYHLFAESIVNDKAFKSVKCKSVQEAVVSKCTEESDVYMGQYDSYNNAKGIYYFKTRDRPPFTL
ncbi:endothelial lipase-like isoform X2 [Diabrotica virgifera virgifera]|uniref:Endothelial lipase-like isoform X2 n=1 Tax=Diabrotica virgifera virgifera TaxID=50390 RepID=A0A6P7GMY8_DIAVI|nr:endothelial lipase-like isoform X2 [Diabrotica virgifera virgifera]